MVDAPSGGAPEQAPRWDLVGTEGCGGVIRFLAPYLIVWGMWIYIGRRSTLVEQQGAHEGGGRAWGGGAPPYLVASSFLSWHRVQVSRVLFVEKITFPKVSFRLDSV